MAQPNEVINLVIALIALPFLLAPLPNKNTSRGRRMFLLAYGLMLVGLTATIVEGFVLPDFFNGIEHLSYACGGIAFAFALHWMTQASRTGAAR